MSRGKAGKSGGSKGTPITPKAASRIQSAAAKESGVVTKGSFASRAQRAAAKNSRGGSGPSKK